MDDTRTQWFNLATDPPHCSGRYEVRECFAAGKDPEECADLRIFTQGIDASGKTIYVVDRCVLVNSCLDIALYRDSLQHVEWRGLANNPNGMARHD